MTSAEAELPTAPRTLEELFTETVPTPLLLFVAAPHDMGGDDERVVSPGDVHETGAAALELLRRGHVPVTADAMATAWHLTDRSLSGGAGARETLRSYARLLSGRCDGVVRIGGPSAVADELVALAAARGARVWMSVVHVPQVAPAAPMAPT